MKTLPIFIAANLPEEKESDPLAVLRKNCKEISWITADIKRISPSFCMHKIVLDESSKNSVQPQKRLNRVMKEVVKNEIIKWLDAGIIYPIFDSEWVSHVQCVPKKGGTTVVEKAKNKFIPTRAVTEWKTCIDYRKLNKATKKDHFPLPFIN